MKEFGLPWRIGAVLIFAIASFITFSLAWPFNPYTKLAYTELPEEACTNGPVWVVAEREIERPALGSLERARVKSYWRDADTGNLESAGDVPIPIQDTELEYVDSPVLREAPSKPGNYYLYSETTAYGTVGIIPRHTTIATYSDDPIEVEDC
jgi:hypothetical protein